MKHLHPALLFALATLLAACGTATTPEPVVILPTQAPATTQPTAAVIVPSATPLPVNTPTPGSEATPTAVPTLAPTETPAVPATPDPNEGVGDVVYSDKLDGTGGWLWTYEDDAAKFGVSTAEKQLNTVAKQSGTWRFTSSNDLLRVGNQQVRVTARPTVCAEQDQYAFLFRGTLDTATSTYSYYAFKLRCDGSARLEKLEGPDTIVLVNWVESPAIQAGVNVENTLMVWANKETMRFYVNDQFLFETADSSLGEGFYGFYLFDRTNGNLAVSWKNLEVRSINLP